MFYYVCVIYTQVVFHSPSTIISQVLQARQNNHQRFPLHGEEETWFQERQSRGARWVMGILTISPPTDPVLCCAVECDPARDSWDYSPHTGLLRHEQAGKCLKVTRTPLKLWLKECNSRDTEQKWHWTHFDDDGLFLSVNEEQKDGDKDNNNTPRTDL